MTKIEDGGPAFPSLLKSGDVAVAEGGLTKREWYAGSAMAAMIARPVTDYPDGETPGFDDIAIDAFRYADAMLAATASTSPSGTLNEKGEEA